MLLPKACSSWLRKIDEFAPGTSLRSIRDNWPMRSNCHCALPMSITASRWPARARTSVPATRNLTSRVPLSRLSLSPVLSCKPSMAAGDRNTVSAISDAKGSSSAGMPSRSGAISAARKPSMPSNFRLPCCPDTGRSSSSTGEATSTSGSEAILGYRASSKKAVRARACRSALPDRLRAAAENSSNAALLTRWMPKPSATPTAIAMSASSARNG